MSGMNSITCDPAENGKKRVEMFTSAQDENLYRCEKWGV
jgi:hypothetical protein